MGLQKNLNLGMIDSPSEKNSIYKAAETLMREKVCVTPVDIDLYKTSCLYLNRQAQIPYPSLLPQPDIATSWHSRRNGNNCQIELRKRTTSLIHMQEKALQKSSESSRYLGRNLHQLNSPQWIVQNSRTHSAQPTTQTLRTYLIPGSLR